MGSNKRLIRSCRRKEIVPDQCYAWLLFSHRKDSEPVAVVVLDVTFLEAQAIDLQIQSQAAIADS